MSIVSDSLGKVWSELDNERIAIGQPPFYHPQADAEDAQVPTIRSIHQTALTAFDDLRTERDQPYVNESNQQS
ncbi:MAG: hypothetical protein JXB07_12210 [Anaerolineae bacterium]|nr:hypothetical protein [Anaerolineae bacterium]